MGEDVRSIMESAGTGNLLSIPENDENPDLPMDKDIPLTEGVAGPSAEPSRSFFMNREEPQEEVSSVKDSVTSDVAKKNLTEGSTGMWDEQPIGIGKEWTLEYLWATGGFELKNRRPALEQQKKKGEILFWTQWSLREQHLRTTRHLSVTQYPWWVRNL